MAGWTRIPVDTDDSPRDDEMQEIKAALAERDSTAQLAVFNRSAITLPSDVVPGQVIGKLGERRQALEDLLNVDHVTLSRPWRAPRADGFAELWAGATGSGRLNVFQHAGLAGTDWTKGLDDPINIRHVNEFRTVLAKVVRLVSGGAAASGTDYIANVGVNDPAWATARASALTGQNGGGGGNLWTPWFGRYAGDLAPPSGYQIDAITAKGATWAFDTSSLAGRTIADAWFLMEKKALYGAGSLTTQHFDFDLRIGAATLGSRNSADAADIAGLWMYGFGFDVWALQIAPTSLVNASGTTTVKAVFTSDPLADVPGWTGPGDFSQAFEYSPTGERAIACLVIELSDYEFQG